MCCLFMLWSVLRGLFGKQEDSEECRRGMRPRSQGEARRRQRLRPRPRGEVGRGVHKVHQSGDHDKEEISTAPTMA